MPFIDLSAPTPAADNGFVDLSQPAPPPAPSGLLRRAADVPVGLLRGFTQLPGALVGLADTVSGGAAGRGVDHILNAAGEAADQVGLPAWARPDRWPDQLRALYSPETIAASAAAHQESADAEAAVKAAGGGWGPQLDASALGALKGLYHNPSAALTLAAENYGGMKAIGMGTAKLLKPFAEGLNAAVEAGTPEAAVKALGSSAPRYVNDAGILTSEGADMALSHEAIKYAAAGEGILTVGQQGQQISQEAPETDWMGRLSSIPAGLITGLISAGVGRIPGLGDASASMATSALGRKTGFGAGSFLARAGRGVLSEGVLEELPQSVQEQIWQNIGEGKPWQEGVGEQAVQGLVTGGMLGAGAAAFHGQNTASPKTILDAPTVDDAIGAFNDAVSGTPVNTHADLLQATAEREKAAGDTQRAVAQQDLEQAQINLALNQGEVVQDADGNYHTNAGEHSAPLKVWDEVTPSASGNSITPEQVAAQRDHYGSLGFKTVHYEDNPLLPDGAYDRSQPNTLFLSNDPQRNAAQVAAHEVTHGLQSQLLPNGRTAGDLLNETIRSGITDEGWKHAMEQFSSTAPAMPEAGASVDEQKAWAEQWQRHMLTELGADIGGEASKFEAFMPMVVARIENKYGADTAKSFLSKFIETIQAAYQRMRGFFNDSPTLSQTWVSNLEQVHSVLADMYARQYGETYEAKRAEISESLRQRDRDILAAESQRDVTKQTEEQAIASETRQKLGAIEAAKQELISRANENNPTSPTAMQLALEAAKPKADENEFAELQKSEEEDVHNRRVAIIEDQMRTAEIGRLLGIGMEKERAQKNAQMKLAANRGLIDQAEKRAGALEIVREKRAKGELLSQDEVLTERLGPVKAPVGASSELARAIADVQKPGWLRDKLDERNIADVRNAGAESAASASTSETATLVVEQVQSILTPRDKKTAATELGHKTFDDVAVKDFLGRYAEWLQQGAKNLGTKLTGLFNKVRNAAQSGALAVAIAFNFNVAEYAKPMPVTVSPASVKISVERPKADFKGVTASADAHFVADWTVRNGRNNGQSFIIADKANGSMYAFTGDGSLISKSPAIFGKSKGDTIAPEIGAKNISNMTDADKLTPAGEFQAARTSDREYGQLLDVTQLAGKTIALHTVYLGTPSEHRAQRMASPNADDHRISFGCINAPADFIKNVVEPHFTGKHLVTILPETQSAQSFFGINDSAYETKTIAGSSTDEARKAGTRGEHDALNDRKAVTPGAASHASSQDVSQSPKVEPTGYPKKYLLPEEHGKLRNDTAQKLVDTLSKLPTAQEMASVALAGKAKRGWYEGSAQALSHVFGPDAPRFTALLAALSPQTSVENNLTNALHTWKNWVAAGRPTDRDAIVRVMGNSVQGDKGVDSVLDAWKNNAVRALTSDDPHKLVISGPKVNSFFRNLIGYTHEVTNDAWMANYALVDQTLFKGGLNAAGDEPGKGPGYLAMSAQVRKAAEHLTKLTGEKWTPAEVQETIWSWAKASYERASTAGETRSVEQLVKQGAITDDLINATPDFRTLFHADTYQKILRDSGYGEQLAGLERGERDHAGAGNERPGVGGQAGEAAPNARHLVAAARRLDQLRQQRASSPDLQYSPKQSDLGSSGRAVGLAEAQRAAEKAADGVRGLEGAPTQPLKIGGSWYVPGPYRVARDAADKYMASTGREYAAPKTYAKLDVERATRIAQAFEEMPHAPGNPEVKAAYRALIDETLAQWEVIKATGLKAEFINAGDPYEVSPRALIQDVTQNNHLWVFPTDLGFGSDKFDVTGNPLLELVNESISGRPVRVNDIFRIVHDYFGHIKDGNGFRAAGEENAWRSHAAMYSELARRALTSETRGQNSWVNYGPFGAQNRVASAADTHYAPQKIGLLPMWASEDGARDTILAHEAQAETEGRSAGLVPLDGTEPAVALSPKASAPGHDLTGVHFSKEARTSLDGAHFGSGMSAAELKRILNSSDKRLRSRAYAYLNNGEGVTPERDVGSQAHRVEMRNLYDVDADRLDLNHGDANALESSVLDNGYHGYFTRTGANNTGNAVLLGEHARNVPVERQPFGYRGEDLAPPRAPEYTAQTQAALGIAGDRNLPSGQMTGAEWKQALGDRAPALDDAKMYYRDEVARAVRDVQASPKAPWVDKMSPAAQEALRKAGVWTPKLTLAERWASLKDQMGLKFIQGSVDQFASIKSKIGEREYILTRMASSSDAGLDAAIEFGRIRLNDAGALQLIPGTKSFLAIVKPLQGEADRFFAWMAGNRAALLSKQDRENLFGATDINELRRLNQKTSAGDVFPSGQDRAAVYAKVLAEYNAFNKSILDIAQKAGIINPEARAKFESQFYVPFFRELDGESKAQGNLSGMVNQYAYKKLTGGENVLHDLLANVMQNWSHLLSASLKNQAATATLEQADKLGIATKTLELKRDLKESAHLPDEFDARKSVFVLKDGKEVRYTVHDPLVLASLSSLDAAAFKGPAFKALNLMKHILTVGTTLSPVFRLRHTVREQITALAANPTTYNFVKNWMDGWKYSARDNPTYGRALSGGAYFRMGMSLQDQNAAYAKQLIAHGIDSATVLDSPGKIKQAWEYWKELGERSDTITRANLYNQSYDAAIKAGKSVDQAHLEASYTARDVMDYGLRGTNSALRMITQTVPFMNARMQGLYKLGRGAVADPRRFAAVIGGVTLATIALSLAYRKDPDYEARSEWDQNNNWWFKIGDKAFRVPKPFEVGAIATVVDRALQTALNGFDPESRERFAKQVFEIAVSQLNMNPIPQAIFPAIELWANKDAFTGRDIESMREEKLTPANRIGPGTSLTAQLLGKNNHLSPEQIDFLVNAYFGWVGAHAVATADLALRPAMGMPAQATRRIDDYFIVGDFVHQLPANQSRFVEAFYEHLRDTQQAFGDMRTAALEGKRDEASNDARNPETQLAPMYLRDSRSIGQITRQLRLIEYKAMDPDQKRAEIDRLSAIRDRIAEQAEKVRNTRLSR